MKVIVIEDEKPAVEKLERMLRDIDPGINVIACLESVEDSINWLIKNPPPDLIFMDIQLDDGLCFEIFENAEISTPVIFTTAYDEYALKAFRVNSVDYLLKPFEHEALKRAFQKFHLLHRPNNLHQQVENLLKQFQPKTKKRLLIKVGEHYRSVQTTDIICFYIKERCNFIYLGRGKSYPVDQSLDKAEKLIDPSIFYRINRNFIVNYFAIKDIIVYSSSRLKIKLEDWPEEDDILVSRERVADFKEWMDR
ncbi:MAG: response regulator transcription factor [Bacteroidales bacterium]|nr:response regulator transcription factor [Bacteroidales bacterium]